jgi:hypothetical protein
MSFPLKSLLLVEGDETLWDPTKKNLLPSSVEFQALALESLASPPSWIVS